MLGKEKRNPRNSAMAIDLIHIVVGILVVVCAVLAFLDPDGKRFLFPVIFWLASFLGGLNGWHRLSMAQRDKKRKLGGILQCLLALVLFAVGVLSAMSTWR